MFGPQMPATTLVGWAARAIFHPASDRPLDILHDRQSFHNPTGNQSKMQWLIDRINSGILADMQTLAKWFDATDGTRFVTHYSSGDPDTTIVAYGSPQRSHGYFYIAVVEVPTCDAEAQQEPPEKVAEHERFLQRARMGEERRAIQARLKAERKLNRVPLSPPAAPPAPGRIAPIVGLQYAEWVNQQYRHTLIIAVTRTRIRVQFQMPRGTQRGWRKLDADGMYTPRLRD